MSRLSSLADGLSDSGRSAHVAQASGGSKSSSSGTGLSVGIPVLGVTVSLSPQSLVRLAEAAGDVLGDAVGEISDAGADVLHGATRAVTRVAQGVHDGAEAVVDGIADVGEAVVDGTANVVGNVVGYALLGALAGGAVLDELA